MRPLAHTDRMFGSGMSNLLQGEVSAESISKRAGKAPCEGL